MSIYEWELKHKKPSIKFGPYIWVCSNGYAHGSGHSPDVAYRAFKKQQLSKIRSMEMLAEMTENRRKQECLENKCNGMGKGLKQFIDRYEHWIVAGFVCLLILSGAVLQTLDVIMK